GESTRDGSDFADPLRAPSDEVLLCRLALIGAILRQTAVGVDGSQFGALFEQLKDILPREVDPERIEADEHPVDKLQILRLLDGPPHARAVLRITGDAVPHPDRIPPQKGGDMLAIERGIGFPPRGLESSEGKC